MIIQKILAPGDKAHKLYYKELDHQKREREIEEESDHNRIFPMQLKRGHVYSFGTYVNALAIEKWTVYTSIDSITIVIRATGDIRVQVYNAKGGYNLGDTIRASGKSEIDARVFCEDHRDYKEYIVELEDINYSGIIYPIIESLEDCQLLNAEYTTNTPMSASTVKPIAVINYNLDANMTKKALKIVATYDKTMPIIICDMTGQLSEQSLTDNLQNNMITTISASGEPGACYNSAFDYIRDHYGTRYTHAIMIDINVEISVEAIERLVTFVELLDDIRSDMIIQGDVLRDGTINDGCGYVIRDNRGVVRFQDFDMGDSGDYVAYESYEEIDYFKQGLMCMPLGSNRRFNPNLRSCVELDYYLRHKPLSITTLNGFFAYKRSKYDEGIIKSYYYRYRDGFIARVDSDFELTLQSFRDYLDAEYRRELKRGNIELAFTIIEATKDFLWGPKIFASDNRVRATKRIAELTHRFNDNIYGRKGKIKDRIKLEQEYSKLCLKINQDYDMILDVWREERQ